MRVLLLVISVLCVAIPVDAVAKPKRKIAVAPLTDDAGNKVGQAVAEALAGKDFAVIGPKEVGREMTKLGLPDELDAKAARKLARKLGAVAVIGGQVSKAGRKRSLHLEIHRRGKPDDGFTVEFKATSAGFRRGVRDEIRKRLEDAGEEPADDDDDEAKKPVAQADDDDRKRKADDDDAAKRSRKPADDGRKRRVAAADEDDEGTVRKRRSRKSSDRAAPLLTARVGAGGSVAQRQLSYETRSGFTQVPPRILTTAGAARIDGEIYPVALTDPGSSLAGLGLAAAYDKTLGLSIKVPNQPVSAPINQSHYAIGARYRFGIGEASSVALGLDYARRQYVADRGGLMAAVLDAPDVDYSAIAPGVSLRVPVASSVAVFGGAGGLLVLGAGGIQTNASYGHATVYGLEGASGVDIALTQQIGLRVALEYSQIMFTFDAKGPTQANNRDADPASQDVMGATDRSIGVAVTVGLVY